jgi:hypothetical protein
MCCQINQNYSNKEDYSAYCSGSHPANHFEILLLFISNLFISFERNGGWFMKIYLFVIFLVFSGLVKAQSDLESDIDIAVQNAKKGIYWALNNIPEKKSKLDNDLISDDKLFSSVKLSKEINGIKIESTGFYNSYSVTLKLFRSNESLIKDGFIKTKDSSENSPDEK